MSSDQSDAMRALRERYLKEAKLIHNRYERIAYFDQAGKTAEDAGALAWKKFAEGMSAWLRDDFGSALALFDGAVSLDQQFACPWHGRGNVLSMLKRYDEALAAYDKAIALDPEYAPPWVGKGNVLSIQERYNEALAAYDKAISVDPDDAYPWVGKGNVLKNQKRYDEALTAYEKAIALDPQFAAPWSGKGNALAEQKRYDEALTAYEKSIDLDPKFADPHYNLGLLYWALDRPADSADSFRRAVGLGLGQPWRDAAESWIDRAERRIKSEESGELPEERERADRASDEALVTDLFEALKEGLHGIQSKKIEFKKEIRESVSRPRLVGDGVVDNMLLVLRDWNSFSPILRRELRNKVGPGPDERLGGGYFLVWKGHGIVIDPGVDFVTQLYRKGLSIADVNTVVITHCHLDHTRDVESLVDLNYRYNRARGFTPHPANSDFRQLEFHLCDSALMKYGQYLKTSGCCRTPMQLRRGGDANRITELIDVAAVPAQHRDISGSDDEAVGLVFSLSDENGPVVRIGVTSDTKWIETLAESFVNCDVLVAHLGTIEVGEGKLEAGEDAEVDSFLTTDLDSHLGTKGCFRLLQRVKPKIYVLGEFGEELVQTRSKILEVFRGLKPPETRLVLGGDSNLAIGLGRELSICCSHPECGRSWTRIPLDQVRPFIGGDFLFQYICSRHWMADDRAG
jgi:tetratricopeptide (TPR) repeat protein